MSSSGEPFLTCVADADLERLGQLLAIGGPSVIDASILRHAGLATHELQCLQGMESEAARRLVAAVLAERRARSRRELELVWTGPEAGLRPSRDTQVVVRELFGRAQRTVLVGGYSFDHGARILEPLHRALAERGVTASLFLHIERASPGVSPERHVASEVNRFWSRNWPFGEPRPDLYYDPRTVPADSLASLHAKCVVVDRRWSFVGSANLTDRGLTRNLEAGVLIEDRLFSQRLAEQWMSLVDRGLVVTHSAAP